MVTVLSLDRRDDGFITPARPGTLSVPNPGSDQPDDGFVIQAGPRTLTVPTPISPVWLNTVPLGEYDVRGALVLGTTRAVVWDTLSHPRDMRPWLPLIGSRELVIVYSHADWDHIWGTAGLPHAGGAVVGHLACLDRFRDDGDVDRELRNRQRDEPGMWDEVTLIPPTTVFDDHLVVDLGGFSLHLHHLPGHTRDCTIGLIPELGVLLGGDTIETPFPVIPPDSPLPRWIAALDRWADDPRIRIVVPAHGPVGGPEILRHNVAYLRSILNGHPLTPGGPLSPFYQTTHEANVRWVGPAA